MDNGIRSIAFPSILITILNQCTKLKWIRYISESRDTNEISCPFYWTQNVYMIYV